MDINLHRIKSVMWIRAKNHIGRKSAPYSDRIGFMYNDNIVSVSLEVRQNTLVDVLDIDMFVEQLPIKTSNKSGIIDILITIPSLEDCQINGISIVNWSESLDTDIDKIQQELIDNWNKSI